MAHQIIIRTSGERTEKECINICEEQGDVHIIRAEPFGQSIMETYIKALEIGEKWTAVIDADVLLYPGIIEIAINELENTPGNKNIFCLDGKTKDKILICNRRAGVHIYKTELLAIAMDLIDFDHIKPESNVRKQMAELVYPTWAGGGLLFGGHDYDQYYKDLWRKAVCQSWKLSDMIDRKNILPAWEQLSKADNDFKVILAAHNFGKENLTADDIVIDKRIDYNANENIERLGLTEKGEM